MSNDQAVVHLAVPKELKNAWVRESARHSMKLSDWLISRVAFPDKHGQYPKEKGTVELESLLRLAGLTLPDFALSVGVSTTVAERWMVDGVPTLPLEMLQLMAGVHPTLRLIQK